MTTTAVNYTSTSAATPTLVSGYAFPSHISQHVSPTYASTPTTPTAVSPTSPTSSRPPTSSTTSAVTSPRIGSTFSSPRFGHAHAHSTTSLASMSQANQNLKTRQIRPPKAPLYVPAVLRPTERPRPRPRQFGSGMRSRGSEGSAGMPLPNAKPLTPPSSAENSFDGKEGLQRARRSTIDADIVSEVSIRRPLSLNTFFPNDNFEGMGITRVVTDEWREDEDVERVTGTPTRDHWKPDSSSTSCSYPQCNTTFSFLNRRHHCRRCGNIFCGPHSLQAVPLDQHARFHPEGFKARACSSCWRDYSAWRRSKKLRGSRENSEGGSNSGSASDGTASGTMTPITDPDKKDAVESPVPTKRNSVKDVIIGSLPRDWTWSTF